MLLENPKTVAAYTVSAAIRPKISSYRAQEFPGRLLLRGSDNTVYTHCMRRIAALVLLCVFGTLLPSATVIALAAPQQQLPICCRAHGAHSCIMGAMANAASDPGPTLRQAACPYGQSLRAITTVTIFADFSSCTSFTLAAANIGRQLIADAVATRMLRRSAPRGPPTPFSV